MIDSGRRFKPMRLVDAEACCVRDTRPSRPSYDLISHSKR
jgi:hypothetical protein